MGLSLKNLRNRKVSKSWGTTYASPEEWNLLLDIVEAARNPDLYNIFDDSKMYPAHKHLANLVSRFEE